MRIHRIAAFLLLCGCLLFIFHSAIFAQEAKVSKSEIYSKLKCCACNVSFAQCVCAEAKEMKAYIDALIETGLPQEGIFDKVAKKFSLDVIIDQETKIQVEKRLIKETGEKRPQIVLEPSFFDFGRVSKKQGKISKIFKLHNKGSASLIVKRIKTTCPCSLASLSIKGRKSPYFGTEGSPENWQAEIKPGLSAELEVVIDLASPHINTGRIIRDVSIATNDPLYPETTVRVQVEVE